MSGLPRFLRVSFRCSRSGSRARMRSRSLSTTWRRILSRGLGTGSGLGSRTRLGSGSRLGTGLGTRFRTGFRSGLGSRSIATRRSFVVAGSGSTAWTRAWSWTRTRSSVLVRNDPDPASVQLVIVVLRDGSLHVALASELDNARKKKHRI